MLGALSTLKSFRKVRALRRAYDALLIRLVKQAGLFDAEYYLDENADVAVSGVYPLRHYVTYGDREGRAPMPFFDPVYYRTRVNDRLTNVNTLLHYVYVGRYLRFSPSPWFDVDFYLAHNKDVAREGIDPLLHYVRYGGHEGRSPCMQFDGAHYLRDNPDVLTGRMNPLLHYLCFGRYEHRRIHPVLSGSGELGEARCEIPPPFLPNEESWLSFQRRTNVDDAVIDVVIPVYMGRPETLHCIHSVLTAASRVPYELIVINDASPDPALTNDLEQLAGKGLFTLLANQANRGFVHTVNRGMGLHPDRDVVLLNSDTEVYDRWLDRLREAATRNPRTGTVTPLSNNATICSYPRFDQDNPYPLELGYPNLDALAALANAGVEVEMPTGVGFCMYIKRACLDEVGLFDTERFGKGYGEENDFCRRAARRGWRHVAAADVFVRHWGSTSFRGEKAKLVHKAMKVLGDLHPDYHIEVAKFVNSDPLREARSRLDWARLQRLRKERNVLIVCHNRGGGSERHVQEDIGRLTRDGHNVILLRPVEDQPSSVTIKHPEARLLPNLATYVLADTAKMIAVLRDLGVTDVHTHGLVDFIPDAATHLVKIVKAIGARLEVNLHDYKVICPRINLVDGEGLYCGEPAEAGCNACLARNDSDFKVSDIRVWRDIHYQALLAADAVLVPDQDVAERLAGYFPGTNITVSPHEDIQVTRVRMPSLPAGEILRIVVVGAIGKIKGFDVLLACARDARQRRLPLEFVLMGYSLNDRLLQEAGVRITGKYQDQEALELLKGLEPHVVWLPSVWPETYSYTLSLALLAGFTVVAFDLGAIAARLRRQQQEDLLLPLDVVNDPVEVNGFFLKKFFQGQE